MKKAKTAEKEVSVESKIEALKKEMFEIRLSKSISGVFDKKKMQDLKKQVIALYSSQE